MQQFRTGRHKFLFTTNGGNNNTSDFSFRFRNEILHSCHSSSLIKSSFSVFFSRNAAKQLLCFQKYFYNNINDDDNKQRSNSNNNDSSHRQQKVLCVHLHGARRGERREGDRRAALADSALRLGVGHHGGARQREAGVSRSQARRQEQLPADTGRNELDRRRGFQTENCAFIIIIKINNNNTETKWK